MQFHIPFSIWKNDGEFNRKMSRESRRTLTAAIRATDFTTHADQTEGTTKMKRLVYLFVAVLALSISAAAQDKAVTLTGNLIDKACSARVAKSDDAQAKAAGHTKNCSLSENCAKSGFGVFADGKFVEFDEKGNAMAKSALEKSAKDKGAMFKVTGKVAEGKMMVENISEVE